MAFYIEKPSLFTIQAVIKDDQMENFVTWQAKLNHLITSFKGFVSLEFVSSPDQPEKWIVVQRFKNSDASFKWRQSTQYHELLSELKTFATDQTVQESVEGETNLPNGLTEVIIARIQPGKEEAYRLWTAKIHGIEAKYPGFRGVYIQSPKEASGENWITLLQFDSTENLDRWLQSEERQELLKQGESLITSMETHRIISPYMGWFASIAKTGIIPPVWKQNMMILLVLFPIVMLELKYLNPFTKSLGLNVSLATFIANALSVMLITFPTMPIALFFLKWWLKGEKKFKYHTLLGAAIVVLLYMIEIIIFWSFI